MMVFVRRRFSRDANEFSLAASLLNCRIYGNYISNDIVVPTHDSIAVSLKRDDHDLVIKTLFSEDFVKKHAKQSRRCASSIISVGGDPEFELIDEDGGIIPVENFGWDSTSPDAEIGHDGAGTTGELRPMASQNIYDVMCCTSFLIKKVSDVVGSSNVRISMTGDIRPLGGHIHLGTRPTNFMVYFLDVIASPIYKKWSGKARGSYARLFAIERKPYGFEYRSLPAAVWSHPKTLEAWLIVFQSIAMLYNGKGIACDTEIFLNGTRLRQPEEFTMEMIEKFLNDNELGKWFSVMYDKPDTDDVAGNWLMYPIDNNEELYKHYLKSIVFSNDDYNEQIKSVIFEKLYPLFQKEKIKKVIGLHVSRGNDKFAYCDKERGLGKAFWAYHGIEENTLDTFIGKDKCLYFSYNLRNDLNSLPMLNKILDILVKVL